MTVYSARFDEARFDQSYFDLILGDTEGRADATLSKPTADAKMATSPAEAVNSKPLAIAKMT